MAVITITTSNSRFATIPGDVPFNEDADTDFPDTLTINPSAFIVSLGLGTPAVLLANKGAWTVNNNGFIFSADSYGLYLVAGNTGVSKITVGKEGEIGSQGTGGLLLMSAAAVKNSGLISGVDRGIRVIGSVPVSISNSGLISGGFYSIDIIDAGKVTLSNTGVLSQNVRLGQGDDLMVNSGVVGGGGTVDLQGGNDTLTNSGSMGQVFLGSGSNKLTNSGFIFGAVYGGIDADSISNSGTIYGDVFLGEGLNIFNNSGAIIGGVLGGGSNDVFSNTGTLTGAIDLGLGQDTFNGGSSAETVRDAGGTDFYNLGGGNDLFIVSASLLDNINYPDTVDGGAGSDTYYWSDSTSNLAVNLDSVPHDYSPFIGGVTRTANLAMGISGALVDVINRDIVKNFENVYTGAGADDLFGNASANLLDSGADNDHLFGYGGNDTLKGGDDLDVLVGGLGKDVLYGGASGDYFSYSSLKDSGIIKATRDVIMDFEDGLDQIDLELIDANTANGSGTNEDFTVLPLNWTGGFTGFAGQLRIVTTTEGYLIEADANGDKKADFSIAVINAAHNISWSSADFYQI